MCRVCMSLIPTNIPTVLAGYQQAASDAIGRKSRSKPLFFRLFQTISDDFEEGFGAARGIRTPGPIITNDVNPLNMDERP